MNSFKNERCHSVTRLPSKLETGGRQFLHKLKSCKDTETKEIRRLRCFQKTIRFDYQRAQSALFWEGNKDKETSSIAPLEPLHNQMLFLPPKKTKFRGSNSRKAHAVSNRHILPLWTFVSSQEWQQLEAYLNFQFTNYKSCFPQLTHQKVS